MGFATIFSTVIFILVFAGMAMMVVNTQKGLADTAINMKEQQKAQADNDDQEITITADSYSATGTEDWIVTYKTEFDLGTYSNTTTNGDQVEMTTVSIAGNYTSEGYNTGFVSNFTTISWNSVMPGGTNLSFQIRSANSTAALALETFVGPDGTSNTYYNVTGTDINETHNQSQYIQWRAFFTTQSAGTTPTLQDLTITTIRPVGHALIQVENTGKVKLDPEETDVYVDGIRLERSDANRLLELEDVSDTQLWNPGEEMNITIFTDIPATSTITISNNYAKDQEVVP